jgi:hypothetical protein
MFVEHENLITALIQWPQNGDLPHRLTFSHIYCAMNIGAMASNQSINFCFTYSSGKILHLRIYVIFSTALFLWLQNNNLPHKLAFSHNSCAMNIRAMATIFIMNFCLTYSI